MIHSKGDSADLSYPYKMPGDEGSSSTVFKITTAEYYIFNGCKTRQIDGLMCEARLGSRRKVVDLDPEVKVIENDAVDQCDEKGRSYLSVSFFCESYEYIKCRLTLSQVKVVEHHLHEINNVHRDDLVQV